MINKIIAFSINNKLIIGLFILAMIGVGIYTMSNVKLGSVPDITSNQVQVMTVSQNLATEDIEQFVTHPVELAMGNLPGVKEIRSVSRFGLSVVTIVFEDDMGIYLPRQLVQEKLSEVKKQIPEQFGTPNIGPITTGLGEIYQYTIEPKTGYDTAYSAMELRTIQDWIVSRQMALVDGVVGVNAFGGYVKQYEIALNPKRLNAMNTSISEVFKALKRNNVNTGGAYIERNHMANFIRGEGLARSLDDIRNIVVKNVEGTPLLVKDVASKVQFGNQVRYGAFTKDGHEAVGGMVLLLRGANPNEVIQNVRDQMKQVEQSLPEGLEINPFLDRSELISRTTNTVATNLTEGALIVIFVLVILLGSFRGGLITASVIPLSLLFAFILMYVFDVWANLMSLGAIDFGIIVDGAVIIVEGTVHEIEQRIKSGKSFPRQKQMDEVAYDAGSKMMNSAFFGQLIILIVFTPILFLTGVEGKMFRPMAFTFGFAVLGAIILCLTYVPMMCALFMKPSTNKRNIFVRLESAVQSLSDKLIGGLQRIYRPLIKGALKQKALVILLAVGLLGGAGYTFNRMGGQFIPQLDEGDIAMQALVRPGSALGESIEVSKRIENILLDNFPEVKTVLARIGVADIPTDPMPMDIADMFIILEKDKSKWVSADTKEELIQKIREELSVLTGVKYVFSQPIELRFNELLTGVREDVAVKLYGEDLDVLAEKKEEMANIIRSVPGASGINPERTSGLPQMTVRYNRQKIAQYGLDIQKLNEYVSAAFAGGKAGVIFEGERRFDMVIRFDEAHRKSINNLKNLFIDLPNGKQIPIKELADIQYRPGPMQISRENTFRRTYVGVNASGRDVESMVNEIQDKLDAQLDLPPGYNISYGGEFENLQRAKARLSIVVPIALFLIFVLLFFALRSVSQSIMIYMAVPLAAIGGIFLLAIRGMPFSISAGVGFVVLFGVAVLNGLVLISRLNSLKEEGYTDLKERILIGTQERLRPILLTATAAIMGFTPMALSTSAGAEVQRPLATVVIGGLISATLLTLIVVPVLYALVESRGKKKASNHGYAGSVILMILMGLGLTLATAIPSKAQDLEKDNLPKISLENAIEKARTNYPGIQASRLEVNRQEAMKKTAWDLGTTQIMTGGAELGGPVTGGESGSPGEGVYNVISVGQQQIDVFGIGPKKKLQREKVALAESALNLTQIEVEREVSQAWARAFAAKNKYRVYERLDSIFNTLERAARIRLETEASSRLEYLSTTNQANQVHIEMEQAYRDYRSALQRLNLWFVTDSLYTVENVSPEQMAKPMAQVRDSLPGHPLMNIYQQRIQVAQANLRATRSEVLPEFNARYGRQRINGQGGFYQFQVGISIPLFFMPEQGRIQSARINRKIAVQELNQTRLQLKAQYLDLTEQYRKWLDSWNYYQNEALPLAREQRQGAITSFREGAIDYVTFLQTIRDAINIEIDSWNTFSNYLDTKYQLEYFLKETNN